MPCINHSRRRAFVSAAALVLAVTACSDDGGTTADPAPTSRTSTSAASTTTWKATSTTRGAASTTTTSQPAGPGDAAKKAVIDRYIGYWRAELAANSGTPNPDSPVLREYATGAQLAVVIDETKANLDKGLAFKRPASPYNIRKVTVLELDGNHAVVQDCVVDDLVIVNRTTGAVVNDNAATHNVRGELTRVDDVWRVSKTQWMQRWEGVAGCARASS